MRIINKRSCVHILALAVATSLFSTAYADPGGEGDPGVFNPNLDALTITNSISDVTGYADMTNGFICPDGSFTPDPLDPCLASILYPISGPVYATMVNPSTGETQGAIMERGSVDATAAFSTSFFGLLGDWSVLPATLPWTMYEFQMSIGDTTFTIIEGMPLTGSAFPGLGPVADPAGFAALRMAGCAGVQADGHGRYANKVGSLCLNGTFRFDGDFNGIGVSNCTIVLHDPLQ